MKNLLSIIAAILILSNLQAATATNDLNATLRIIFEEMQIDAEVSNLEGKVFEANLTVKVATEKFLIFSDAYLQADEDSKYQIGKWMFTPDQVTALKVKRGSVLTVKFRIEAIKTKSQYADMPHFTATIISMTPYKKVVNPDERISSSQPLRSSP
jgi:hypothetical protein